MVTFTECVPNAVVTFSNSCSQATTTYDSSQNCWVTTLPANCNPGDVFLSGLPWQVPNGCNLSGATVTWNIGQSANNCGSSSVNWQVGCQGYSDFGQNGCDGNDRLQPDRRQGVRQPERLWQRRQLRLGLWL